MRIDMVEIYVEQVTYERQSTCKREIDCESIATDSCKSDAIDSEHTFETIDVDPMPAPSVAKMGSSAQRSKLSQCRQGRQRDRRAMQANTEMDLVLLRRFEVESVATKSRQLTRERQLRDVLALGTSTTIDEIAKVALVPVIYHPPQRR